MNNDKFFIYAGPPKTASTWLYTMLWKHPEVALPIKEMRYFHIKEKVGNVSLLHRVLGRHPILKRERKRFLRQFKKRVKRAKNTNGRFNPQMQFLLRYEFSKNINWFFIFKSFSWSSV